MTPDSSPSQTDQLVYSVLMIVQRQETFQRWRQSPTIFMFGMSLREHERPSESFSKSIYRKLIERNGAIARSSADAPTRAPIHVCLVF